MFYVNTTFDTHDIYTYTYTGKMINLICCHQEMNKDFPQETVQVNPLQDRALKLVLSCTAASSVAFSASFLGEHDPFFQLVRY